MHGEERLNNPKLWRTKSSERPTGIVLFPHKRYPSCTLKTLTKVFLTDECRNVVKLQRVKRLLCTQKRVTARLRVALRKSESEEQRLRAKLQRLRGKEPQTGSDQA